MKFITASLFALAAAVATASPVDVEKRAKPLGVDVSHFQGTVNFNAVKANGASFAYIKATDGSSFIDPKFNANYVGATKAGLIRGAYHFARPSATSGAAQAKFFLAHGGRWSKDGITLPGALDVEYNPSGNECYGLSASAMVAWIRDFSDTYHASTGVYPVIYTTTDWWKSCTGNSAAFGQTNPLWLAHPSSTVGPLPAGWSYETFWQFASKGSIGPGDQDEFNGSLEGLKKIALG